MKSGGGKTKGAEFERECCKALSLWVSGGERDDIYWRSAMSGGRATVQNKKGGNNTTQLGDISCIDSTGEWLTNTFIIENKFYRNVHLDSIIYPYSKNAETVFQWWTKLTAICDANRKLPMLIFKQNNRDILVGTDVPIHDWKIYSNDLKMYIGDFNSLLKTDFNIFKTTIGECGESLEY